MRDLRTAGSKLVRDFQNLIHPSPILSKILKISLDLVRSGAKDEPSGTNLFWSVDPWLSFVDNLDDNHNHWFDHR